MYYLQANNVHYVEHSWKMRDLSAQRISIKLFKNMSMNLSIKKNYKAIRGD